MIKILLFIFLTSAFCTNAQSTNAEKKLYHFLTKDSLLGVKDQDGKVIIEPMPDYRHWSRKELQTPIEGNTICFDSPIEHHPPSSWGSVYNRKGEFLYSPAQFDNGPDPFVEGYQRFVKDKKMGFVNKEGEVVIKASHDYVGFFMYGIAPYCDGCTWTTKGEHRFIEGGTWGYMNSKGENITVMDKRSSVKDQVIDSTHFLPYQFSYSQFEKKIVDYLYRLEDLSNAHFAQDNFKLDSVERKFHYEIVDRPTPSYPYYHVVAYTYSNKEGYYGDPIFGLNFCVSKDGKEYFYLDYDKKIPLKEWINKELKEAKEYLKEHPYAPNRF